MELGRFTLKGGSGGQPATKLIILHVRGERNVGFAEQPAYSISQWKSNFESEKSYHHRGHRGTQRKICGPLSLVVRMLFRAGSHFVGLGGAFRLLGNDHVFDLVIGGLGNDLLLH